MAQPINDAEIQRLKQLQNNPPKLRQSSFYGIDRIAQAYLKLPRWLPLTHVAYLEHGINIYFGYPDARLKMAENEVVLLDNAGRYQDAPKQAPKAILGPLFMHYQRMNGYVYNPKNKGTVFFPAHSTAHVDAVFSWEDVAKMLRDLPAEYQPVTACIYWVDVLKGHHKAFEKYGIPVVTNGHISDTNYAEKFFSLLTQFRYVGSNSPGSYLFYAADMGMPTFLTGPEETYTASDTQNTDTLSRGQLRHLHPYVQRVEKVFRYETLPETGIELTTEQKELVAEVIGRADWDTPEAIRKLLLQNWWKVLVRKVKQQFFSKSKTQKKN